MRALAACAIAAVVAIASLAAQPAKMLTFEHQVAVKSTVPALAGRTVDLYVRERISATTRVDAIPADRVVLFVHGAGTPAEVAFDVPHSDYSWMAYLATAGFDVFSMDTTGYGRSVRPAEMNDPCNLSADQQKQFIPNLIKEPCAPTYPGQLTNLGSDWNDINAVVDHIRTLRRVEKVSLVAWSLGGPRAGGYAAQHPDKVSRLVLLAPAYNRNAPADPPALPNQGTVFTTQSRAEFDANWDRQVECANQVDPAVRDVVWKEMVASDPVGAKWGTGVRRAPSTTSWGWNAQMIGGTTIPTLLVAAALDRQVPAERVKAAYDDHGAADKVLLDLGCSSHNAMWERNHLLLFAASLEWLTKGTVNGARSGVVRMGYPTSPPLQPVHSVRGNALRVDWPTLTTIHVQRGFRYAGGHRFILRNVADAEQHAFADVGVDGNISSFYWFQFESLLPAAKNGYDYSKDAPLTLAGLDWRTNVRRYTAPPEPDGDQAALYKLFAARGWRQPLPALRARIVHVPADAPRKELMIIYAEATTSSAPPTEKESAGLIARAQAGLRLIR